MGVLDELSRLSSAEDFFTFLEVPFDAAVVRVARLHILRRMGQYLRGSEVEDAFTGLDDTEIRALCRGHLEQAYQDFVASTPIAERLFKVHRDAVAPKPPAARPFVPLAALEGAKAP
ncbi:nitrogenase stabilizing/protective protein NifW [Nitrospirillum sp. BR 11752]|uniref:Nitrogenase-stabilizing/protective protein NifW n=1 Tax=Nitrospirillum amazonense TaxID=28077 RepID=A0A560H0I8_9PROT|nr:nitrogenase stabilizing/protective protein NifW [Nitrospirillum amazonense]MEE3624020.1 nitrogenase stabilizing/protective protein NifW [Nitrospirillum sp. BR 11752]TWB39160.1 nitrogenase-stabilizing/protective protein [Nitrospirillum amazonense]